MAEKKSGRQLLADWLRNEGRQKQWLAKKLGISPSEISLILRGAEPPSERRAALAEITGGAVPAGARWS